MGRRTLHHSKFVRIWERWGPLHTVIVRGLYVLSQVYFGSKGNILFLKFDFYGPVRLLDRWSRWLPVERDELSLIPGTHMVKRRELASTSCPLMATLVPQTYAHHLYLKYRSTGWVKWLQQVKAFVTKPDNLSFILWDPEGQRRALISDSSPLTTERGGLTVYLSLNK